jgi:hypothetical protein
LMFKRDTPSSTKVGMSLLLVDTLIH